MRPEDLRDVVGAYHRFVADTVARFDGYVAKYMGDSVLVYFGYPRPYENNAECAVRPALALVDAVGTVKAPERLRVRVAMAARGPASRPNTANSKPGQVDRPAPTPGNAVPAENRCALSASETRTAGPIAYREAGAEPGGSRQHQMPGLASLCKDVPIITWLLVRVLPAPARSLAQLRFPGASGVHTVPCARLGDLPGGLAERPALPRR